MYCSNLTALTSLLNSTHLIALSCCPTELSVAELISKVFSSPSNPVIYNFIVNLPKYRVMCYIYSIYRAFFWQYMKNYKLTSTPNMYWVLKST